MTEQPGGDPPHVTIEFVGGPFCGTVVDSRVQRLRAKVVRRLAAAAGSERPGTVRMQRVSARRVRVAVGRLPRGNSERPRDHRYRLEVELGFAGRVLFRAVYTGVGV